MRNAWIATKAAQSWYLESLFNGKGDAFRHAYFIALNAADLGTDLTRRLSEAHEENPGHPMEKERATTGGQPWPEQRPFYA